MAEPVALDTSSPVPADALASHTGVLGKTGTGKTYASKSTIAEPLLEDGRQVVIVDPTGVWWGLRSAADGKAPGFPVAIFGGEHADVPIAESAGTKLGELLATRRLSAIVDLSEMMTGERTRFMTDFFDALYRHKARRPLYLIVDEADAFAPQSPMPQERVMQSRFVQIVRRGRAKGFCVTMITQRPASISKEVLTQIETLVSLRVTAPQDRKAIEEWVKGQADAEAGREVLDSLAKLKDGEAWIWSPKLEVLKRAKIPRIRTFDSSASPSEDGEGELPRPETLADVDVDALRSELAAPEPEAEAKGPRVDVAAIERRAREEGRREGFAEGFLKCQAQMTDAITAALRGVVAMPEAAPAPPPPPPVERPKQPAAAPTGDLTRPQQRVLEALAFWTALGIAAPSRYQLGAAAGYSPTSGGFGNILGQLRGAGLVAYPDEGCVALTDAGMAAAPTPAAGRARERLGAVLSAPQAKVLDALPRNGAAISREALGAATGYSPTSGGFGNLIGSLRSLGLVTYPRQGMVACEMWVWR